MTNPAGPGTPWPVNRPASPPIYQASGWFVDDLDQAERIFTGAERGATYATLGGVPNQSALESMLRTEHGAPACVATSGGMSALNATFTAHLQPGARIVVSKNLFGLTLALLGSLRRWGVETIPVDPADHDAVRSALGTDGRMLLVETISNPLTRVPDLHPLAEIAHGCGALFVVDNTFAGPRHMRPLDFGADLVVESVTKSLAGHHDAILGAVLGSPADLAPISAALKMTAGLPAPFAAWLGCRGLETYALRQDRSARTALEVASWLERRLEVRAVHYPGLASHPDHLVAMRCLRGGFGSTMAVDLATDFAGVERFLAALERIPILMSLGGTRTTLTHPARTSHRPLSAGQRAEMGVTDTLLRIAVGLEATETLMEDFDRGLRVIG